MAAGAAAAGADGRAGGRTGAFGGVFVCGAAGFGAGFGAVCAASGDTPNASTSDRTAEIRLERVTGEVMQFFLTEKRVPVVAAADHTPEVHRWSR